mmetsp:Transcript_40714/g.117860  ORF Transcript_40714/g.117860 Transcript_40714/m.117860 type:complete len:121 (-) Transcript_40714:84-446(-)
MWRCPWPPSRYRQRRTRRMGLLDSGGLGRRFTVVGGAFTTEGVQDAEKAREASNQDGGSKRPVAADRVVERFRAGQAKAVDVLEVKSVVQRCERILSWQEAALRANHAATSQRSSVDVSV